MRQPPVSAKLRRQAKVKVRRPAATGAPAQGCHGGAARRPASAALRPRVPVLNKDRSKQRASAQAEEPCFLHLSLCFHFLNLGVCMGGGALVRGITSHLPSSFFKAHVPHFLSIFLDFLLLPNVSKIIASSLASWFTNPLPSRGCRPPCCPGGSGSCAAVLAEPRRASALPPARAGVCLRAAAAAASIFLRRLLLLFPLVPGSQFICRGQGH